MKNRNFALLVILFVWFSFASPFFLSGKAAFPSSYQVNFFSPWNSYPEFSGPVKNNAQPDIITQIYPWRYFDIQELKKDNIPLWNPYSFAGTPHLANYQSAVFFPLNILFFLPLQFIDVWSLLVVLQPLLAGFFMYILLRKYRATITASIISSLSFMFCGFIVTWMGYATLGYAILPLPLAFYAIEKYIETKKHLWLILLSLTFAFSYFSGHFQTSIYFSLAVISYIFYSFIFYKQKREYTEAFLFSIFGILLAMPQILPSIEFYFQSIRSGLFQKIEAIPWKYIPTLIAPDFYGNPVTRNDWFGHYAEWNAYSGVIAFCLSLLTIFKVSKRIVFFIIMALASILLAYNTPLLSFIIFLKIPVLSTSAASRVIVLFSFSIAVLAGFGFDMLLLLIQENKKYLYIWCGVIVVILLALGIVAFGHILPVDKAMIARKNLILPSALLIVFLLSLIPLFIKRSPKYVFIFSCIIVILSAFEMYRFASKWQSFDSKKDVFVNLPVTNFLKNLNHTDRIVGLSGAQDGEYYNAPILSGYDPLYKEEYGTFIQYVAYGKNTPPERSVVNFPLDGKYTSQTINFLGVKYIVHKISDGSLPWAFPFRKYPLNQFSVVYEDAGYRIYRNNKAFPRAYTTPIVTKVARKNMLSTLFSSDLKKSAYVEEDIGKIDNTASGEAEIISYTPGRIDISVNTTGKTFLILTDNYYPGWKVTINGLRGKIYKTDYAFRGVIVPKGASKVVFTYMPQSFLIGIYLSLLGLLGIIMSIVMKSFKTK